MSKFQEKRAQSHFLASVKFSILNLTWRLEAAAGGRRDMKRSIFILLLLFFSLELNLF